MIPGELITQPGEIELNPGLPRIRLRVANRGDRPIQVGSHFHFYEVNEALDFVREQTRGMRLDIPAGTAVRFEPGDEREVTLVPLAGSPSGSQSPAEGNPPAALSHRQVYGFNGRINGRLEEQA